ncbi:MAG: glycosyltransferase [Sediminibacterium sp.]
MKVCYFTTKVASDIRVFEKECTSLAKAGYSVYLVSPNATNEVKNGVSIIGAEFQPKNTFARLFILPFKLYRKALSIDADIYHFNEPSALHYGLLLKLKGKKVIFDSFEDHPTLILEHKTLPSFIMKLISKVYEFYEYLMCRNFDAVILCYHWSQERLAKACKNNALIFNFPIVKSDSELLSNRNAESNTICYAGLFSEMWNIENILSAISKIDDIKFNLAGHGTDQIIAKFRSNIGWEKVNYLGQIKHNQVFGLVYSKSTIGMALLDYIPLCKGNIGNMSNNKFFEYLLAGIPIICTDFILWKEIVENNNCGICVNPRNIDEIIKAIVFLKENPDVADTMGKNGRRIVIEKYNWQQEERKLLDIYAKITN